MSETTPQPEAAPRRRCATCKADRPESSKNFAVTSTGLSAICRRCEGADRVAAHLARYPATTPAPPRRTFRELQREAAMRASEEQAAARAAKKAAKAAEHEARMVEAAARIALGPCQATDCDGTEREKGARFCEACAPVFMHDPPPGWQEGKVPTLRLVPYKAAPISAPLPAHLALEPLPPLDIIRDGFGGWTSNGAATRAG